MTPVDRTAPIPESYRRVTPTLTVAGAVKALESLRRLAEDQFYGDRDGHVLDPFGHEWTIASHIEDVTPEELTRRMTELFGS